MVQVYRKHWHKESFKTSLGYLRDLIVYFLPIPRLPLWVIKLLYGVIPEFIFFVHPRRSEDIFRGFPTLSIVRKFFDKQTTLNLISKLPPIVIGVVKTPTDVNGLVISSFSVPAILANERRTTLKEAFRGLAFASKISKRFAIVGLGGWWPAVTRRGIGLKDYAKKRNLVVTNGHCGTLVSLFLMIKEISEIASYKLEDMSVSILGVGKMGANLARAIYNKIGRLILIDVNAAKLSKVTEELRGNKYNHTVLQEIVSDKDPGVMKNILGSCHVLVCTTTNLRRLIIPEDIPPGSIIIDDARPEAVSRHISTDKIVLEGGLMKIVGVSIDYDFGFGYGDNVFGCLAETYALALDKLRTLRPTLGDVDINNYEEMKKFCLRNNLVCGDFKTLEVTIHKAQLYACLKNKSTNGVFLKAKQPHGQQVLS